MTGTLRADRLYVPAPAGGETVIRVFPDEPLLSPHAAPPVSPEDHWHAAASPVLRRPGIGAGVSFGTHLVILLVLLQTGRPPRFGDVAPEPSTVRFVFAEPSPVAPEPSQPIRAEPPPHAQPQPPAAAPTIPPAAPPATAAALPLPKVWTPTVRPPRKVPAAPVAPPSHVAAAPRAGQRGPIDTDWAARVSDWLVQHRTDPTDARLRNVRGVVVIRCNVRPDGQVVDVSVQRSSGNRRLDRAALAMVRRARLPPFPSNMTQPLQSIIVPIRYDLE